MRSLIKKNREIISYLIIGVLTTIVSLSSYYLVTITFLNPNKPLELTIANIISWVLAVTFAYFTNRIFVFRSKNDKVFREAVKFYLARVLTLLMDISFMFLLVNVIKIDDKISKLIVQVLIFISNYLISKFLVFKNTDK